MNISIDIGTSYSCAGVMGPGGRVIPIEIGTGVSMFGSKYSLPSAVFMGDNEILIGQAAMNNRFIQPQRFRMEFKRDFGSEIPIHLGERDFLPEDLYTELFCHIKKQAEKMGDGEIETTYLTCPASYGETLRKKLKSAANAAGLFEQVLVDEPAAAAMGYCAQGHVKDGQTLLIYDFGGGTFDTALLVYQNETFQLPVQPEGLPRCGGIDMDRLIFQDMIKRVGPETLQLIQKDRLYMQKFTAQLSEQAVKAKHHLSFANIYRKDIAVGLDSIPYELTLERFEEMIAPMVGQTIQVCNRLLEHAGKKMSDVSAILMAGGTSRIPLVRRMVNRLAGKTKVFLAPDPDMIVVQGALEFYKLKDRKISKNADQKEAQLSEENDGDEMFRLYMEAAQKGHARAQRGIGDFYYYGRGVEQNRNKAFQWYEKAAQQGDAGGQNNAGLCCMFGHGTAVNQVEAVCWFEKAAQQNEPSGIYHLAVCYTEGNGVQKDLTKAFILYLKAAKMGLAAAQSNVGYLYELGEGTEKNQEKALEWYLKATEQNEPTGIYHLAECYDFGKGVQRDLTKAFKLYLKAAEMGLAEAQSNVGFAYEFGEGTEKNQEKALEWYLKAAEQKNPNSIYRLAVCYHFGKGVKKDLNKAFKLYLWAAKMGFPAAQSRVAYAYEFGEGTEKNHKKALKWHFKSSEHRMDGFCKGICYAKETGVQKDSNKVFKLYLQTADQVDTYTEQELIESVNKENTDKNTGKEGGEEWLQEIPWPSVIDECIKSAGVQMYDCFAASNLNTRIHDCFAASNFNTLRKRCGVPSNEIVLLSCDCSWFNRGKNGFILTPKGIYCKHLTEFPLYVDWYTFTKQKLSLRENTIYLGDCVIAYFYMYDMYDEKAVLKFFNLLQEKLLFIKNLVHK